MFFIYIFIFKFLIYNFIILIIIYFVYYYKILWFFICIIYYFYIRIYKKKSGVFNYLFVADRILRAWYRGIKHAGPHKRGRVQDIPYLTKKSVYNGIWRIFIECGKTPTGARAKCKGSKHTKKLKEFSTTPIYYIYIILLFLYIFF